MRITGVIGNEVNRLIGKHIEINRDGNDNPDASAKD